MQCAFWNIMSSLPAFSLDAVSQQLRHLATMVLRAPFPSIHRSQSPAPDLSLFPCLGTYLSSFMFTVLCEAFVLLCHFLLNHFSVYVYQVFGSFRLPCVTPVCYYWPVSAWLCFWNHVLNFFAWCCNKACLHLHPASCPVHDSVYVSI